MPECSRALAGSGAPDMGEGAYNSPLAGTRTTGYRAWIAAGFVVVFGFAFIPPAFATPVLNPIYGSILTMTNGVYTCGNCLLYQIPTTNIPFDGSNLNQEETASNNGSTAEGGIATYVSDITTLLGLQIPFVNTNSTIYQSGPYGPAIIPDPFVTATVTAAPQATTGGNAEVDVTFVYQIAVIDLDPTNVPLDNLVPLDFEGFVSTSGKQINTGDGGGGTSASVGISSSDGTSIYNYATNPPESGNIAPVSQTASAEWNAAVNSINGTAATNYYTISLGVSASADAAQNGSTNSASAYIDPMISIDSSFADASDYAIAYSPGIVTFPSTTPVPEPGSGPLLAGGLFGLGIYTLGRRRRPPLA